MAAGAAPASSRGSVRMRCGLRVPHAQDRAVSASDGHVMAPDDGGPYDTCEKCAKAIQVDVYGSGRLVTMIGRNAECYAR